MTEPDSLWGIVQAKNEEARQRFQAAEPDSVDLYTKPIPRKAFVRRSILVIFLVLVLVAALVLWLDWHFIWNEMLGVWK